jgi:hypothetical protein
MTAGHTAFLDDAAIQLQRNVHETGGGEVVLRHVKARALAQQANPPMHCNPRCRAVGRDCK